MAQPMAADAKGGKGKTAAQGHNTLTDDVFLGFVNEFAAIDAKMDEIKGLRRSARKRAKAAGIELGQLDAVVRMADWSMEEVRSYFGTQTQYAIWMGLPLGTQADLFAKENAEPVDEPHGAEYWQSKGYGAGIRGQAKTPPDECHPTHHQDFFHGWDKAQAKLGEGLKGKLN
jgi:hypothetical protein